MAEKLPLSATQKEARMEMLARLLPTPAWTAERLSEAEETGLLTEAKEVLASFRDAAARS